MITEKQITEIREQLEESKNPLFFFHDDADGLCSFLLLYRFVKEGHGIIVKTTPKVDEKFLKKVQEYHPDKIFIVDIAIVEQDFIDKANVPIIWIDHHEPLERSKVKYYNPRIKEPLNNVPSSYMCYHVVQQDLWIAMAGCIGDWFMPSFADEFKAKYSELISEGIKDPEDALFKSKIGSLARMMEFCLKGKTSEAMKCVKIMTRIKSPYEILNQETAAGRYIYKRYETVNKDYTQMLNHALSQKPDKKFLMFQYIHSKISFTKDIANELLYRNPTKIIIIAREKSDEMKISIRSKKTKLPELLKKALVGIDGFGGGHEHACGANIKKKDFDRFIENFKRQID